MGDKNWHLNDSGILRKKEVPKEDLLVFGYSCKLFRDDQRALFIDQGKHLIPWMGDEALKIDRYDGRGTLYDLSNYEPSQDGGDRWFGLSSEEKYVEQMCDEERYRALKTNEDEEALYQEEEVKRIQQALDQDKAYGQVGYNYSDEKKAEDKRIEQEKADADDEDDIPFVPPHELDIPVDMVVPEKTKLNAIIERTAQFICEQGAQMEVLLKMKQANNPQFQFLSFGSALHPYYRHLYMAIKTGRYRPQAQKPKVPEEKQEEDANAGHYLHPSLATPCLEVPEPAPIIPNINYKPSADCAYSMLVNKIKEKQTSLIFPIIPNLPPKESKPLVLDSSPGPTTTSATVAPQSPIIRNDDESSDSVAPTASSPEPMVSNSTLRKRRKKARAEQALVDSLYYDRDENEAIEGSHTAPGPVDTPPPHLQLIIDKMASYVAKNGIDFEGIVKSKGDERFSFLEEGHEYHPYYRQKVNLYLQLNPVQYPSDQLENSNEAAPVATENSGVSSKKNNQTRPSIAKPVPVCFSIKKPKESETLENRSALPVEESSEDEDSDDHNSSESKSSKSNQDVKKSTDNMEKAASHAADNSAKWNEERVKDKLSAVAKEKLIAKERERQIQSERKKRAAAFLNLLQKDKLVTSNQLISAGASSSHDVDVPDDVESLPSPSSVIAISDSSSDELPNSDRKKCNGSVKSHPLIDLCPTSPVRRRKRSPSPVESIRKKKRKHRSKSSKKSHKSSHKNSSSLKYESSSKHRKKHRSRSRDSLRQSHKHKKHSHSKHKRHYKDKKLRHKSGSSSSASDSESSSSLSSS